MKCDFADIDWDDIRTVLAVSRGGTLSGAARLQGVNQTTVSRRVKALETVLGERLFMRAGGRHVPTALGVEVVAHGERIEAEVLALTLRVGGDGAFLAGTVRLTAVGSIAETLVVPGLDAFLCRYGDLRLEVILANVNLNFSRRETDMALRLGRSRAGRLKMRKLGDVPYDLYAPMGSSRQAALCDGRWVGYDESLAGLPEQRWLERNRGSGEIVFRANSARLLADAIAQGIGVGVLPRALGDGHEGLMRVGGTQAVLYRELWLLIHEDVAAWPRIRVVADWLVEQAKKIL